MRLEVVVGETEIKESDACRGVFNECAVARALKKLGCENIDVDEDRILISLNQKRYLFKTPLDASIFISDFDSDRKVKPITFVLEKPKLATIDDERKPVNFISDNS